jgi:hypothetical protein
MSLAAAVPSDKTPAASFTKQQSIRAQTSPTPSFTTIGFNEILSQNAVDRSKACLLVRSDRASSTRSSFTIGGRAEYPVNISGSPIHEVDSVGVVVRASD